MGRQVTIAVQINEPIWDSLMANAPYCPCSDYGDCIHNAIALLRDGRGARPKSK